MVNFLHETRTYAMRWAHEVCEWMFAAEHGGHGDPGFRGADNVDDVCDHCCRQVCERILNLPLPSNLVAPVVGHRTAPHCSFCDFCTVSKKKIA